MFCPMYLVPNVCVVADGTIQDLNGIAYNDAPRQDGRIKGRFSANGSHAQMVRCRLFSLYKNWRQITFLSVKYPHEPVLQPIFVTFRDPTFHRFVRADLVKIVAICALGTVQNSHEFALLDFANDIVFISDIWFAAQVTVPGL